MQTLKYETVVDGHHFLVLVHSTETKKVASVLYINPLGKHCGLDHYGEWVNLASITVSNDALDYYIAKAVNEFNYIEVDGNFVRGMSTNMPLLRDIMKITHIASNIVLNEVSNID